MMNGATVRTSKRPRLVHCDTDATDTTTRTRRSVDKKRDDEEHDEQDEHGSVQNVIGRKRKSPSRGITTTTTTMTATRHNRQRVAAAAAAADATTPPPHARCPSNLADLMVQQLQLHSINKNKDGRMGDSNQARPTVHYLTSDQASWYILQKAWWPSDQHTTRRGATKQKTTTTPALFFAPSSYSQTKRKSKAEGSPSAFEREWDLHPARRHQLSLFGRTVEEKRWSQAWGQSYRYSGAVNAALPLPTSVSASNPRGENTDSMVYRPLVGALVDHINLLMHQCLQQEQTQPINNDPTNPQTSATEMSCTEENGNQEFYSYYNTCLQNWYRTEDQIGWHADDERTHRPTFPIFSLTWGGTRRFLLRSKTSVKKAKKAAIPHHNDNKKDSHPVEVYLEDGDLLIMGGTCQQTHHHCVPAFRKTRDPPTGRRINWTIRSFLPTKDEAVKSQPM